jgi:pantoate kinase
LVIVAQLPVSVSTAFSPGHVTGFFATGEYLDTGNLDDRGSLGAGFNINKGIKTTVKVFESSSKNYEIMINGIRTFDARVSKFVIERYLQMVDAPLLISVEHEAEIPIGYGLGSSGAGALSLSYALNDALNTNLSTTKAASIAHYADVSCKTGLGTVISEFTGGFEFRTKIGGPGMGKVLKIPVDPDYCAILLCIEPLSTSFLLSKDGASNYPREEINGFGKRLVDRFAQNPSLDNFLSLSFDYAFKCGLVNGACKDVLELLWSKGIKSSIALYGHTIFTIVKREDLETVTRLMNQFKGMLIICDIDNSGARLLKNY